ncbi:MAG: hypothetical protein ABIA63_01620 [bacterium]
MRPFPHLAASIGISGCVYAASSSISLAAIQACCGILIDIDHVLEYIIRNKTKLSFKEFYTAPAHIVYKRVFFFFHSYELSLLAGMIIGYLYAPSNGAMVFLGLFQHLLFDQWKNPAKPLSYFIIWRLYNGFKTDIVFTKHPRR